MVYDRYNGAVQAHLPVRTWAMVPQILNPCAHFGINVERAVVQKA